MTPKQHDIRQLFKAAKQPQQHQPLPQHHKADFLKKLDTLPTEKSSVLHAPWLKIAAILFLSLGTYYMVTFNTTPKHDTKVLVQIEAIETQYLQDIDTEWQKFKTLTNDTLLIQRYEKKLNDLHNDYLEINNTLKTDTNNSLIVQDLIDNLQTRLQILKRIQQHISLLHKNSSTL